MKIKTLLAAIIFLVIAGHENGITDPSHPDHALYPQGSTIIKGR